MKIRLCEPSIEVNGKNYSVIEGVRFDHKKYAFLCKTTDAYVAIGSNGWSHEILAESELQHEAKGACDLYVKQNSQYRNMYLSLVSNNENYKQLPAPDASCVGVFLDDASDAEMKALQLARMVTAKEKQMLAEVQKRAQVRKTTILQDFCAILKHMNQMGLRFKSMKDCKVTVSQCNENAFPNAYGRHVPEGTVCEYIFTGSRIKLVSCCRGCTNFYRKFELTDDAKEKLVERVTRY